MIGSHLYNSLIEGMAQDAYELADAMLIHRKETPDANG